MLKFFDKGINEHEKQLLSYFNNPNLKYNYKDFDGSLIYVHFLDLYKVEYNKLKKEQSNIASFQESKRDKPNWFYIGVKLATGELKEIFDKKGGNYTKTAEELSNNRYTTRGLRPYISESISNTNKNDKNIYKRNEQDILSIIEYCKSQDLKIVDEFMTEVNKDRLERISINK